MRFVTFMRKNSARPEIGLRTAGGLRAPVADGFSEPPRDLKSLLLKGSSALMEVAALIERSGTPINVEDIDFLPPVLRPGKIICVGLNYLHHTKESNFEQPDYPTLFLRTPQSFTGHCQPIVRPLCSQQFDYEGELVAFIGKGGKHIDKAFALDHVAGYSISNEGSVRDYQFKSPQWTVGKNFDRSGSIGPDFVTADELPPGGSGLKIETRVNGQTVQSANTAEMVFDLATVISLVSEAMALEPGDVILTGTPAGVGLARHPRLFLRPGDIVEVEIENIGLLQNSVVDESI